MNKGRGRDIGKRRKKGIGERRVGKKRQKRDK